MARARCGIGCEYTVYSGYLTWSFIFLAPLLHPFLAQSLPRSLPPSRRPCLAPFLPRLFPWSTLPPSTLPSPTDASCLCSVLVSSLSLRLLYPSPFSPSLPFFPLPPSPCSLPLPPLPPSLPLSLPPSILPRPFPVSHHRFLPPSRPLLPPSLPPSILPRSFPAPRCLLASCRATRYTLCVCIQIIQCWRAALAIVYGEPSHEWHWDNGVVVPSAGGSRLPWQRTPTTNPFLTNSKKSDGRNMLQTHINTVEARTFPTVHTAIPGAI